MKVVPGEDPIAHLEQEILETQQLADENKNLSRSYWTARLSGLQHALDIIKGK